MSAKWMIASDVHGSATWCRAMLERFAAERAGRLLLLGDLLYHGPRNDLPDGYDPKTCAALLNGAKSRILCVRGNCDAEVDQMMLDFPAMAEYAAIPMENGGILYLAHGHHASESEPPPLREGDILLCGHTHVPKCAAHKGFTYMNPGSVAIPKEGSAHSYMLWEEGRFEWKRLEDGAAYMRYQIGDGEAAVL